MAYDKTNESQVFARQESLCWRFPIKKLGEANSSLDLEIYRDREKRKKWLVQRSYIHRIEKTYNLKKTGKLMTPISPDYDMSPNTGAKLSSHLIQSFLRKVGSATYEAICTRPDIALAVSMCADHLVNPSTRHLHAITHILQYLVNTNEYGNIHDFLLTKPAGPHLDAFFMASDASFGDVDGRKSFIAFLYGSPVLWHASKQHSVTTSTTEDELVALSAAARELIALRRFLAYVTKNKDLHMTLICDNHQTVKMLT